MSSSPPPPLAKYPRTFHLEHSRLGPKQTNLGAVSLADAGEHLVVEEKLDGSHCGICFSSDADLWLFSRGEFLRGGPGEAQFALLKSWAAVHAGALLERLEDRFVLHGEWLAAKHTVFYDQLAHLFVEYDVYDRRQDLYLDTPSRRWLLDGLGLVSAPVRHQGAVLNRSQLEALAGQPSAYRSESWPNALAQEAALAGVPAGQALAETDQTRLPEGLYVKHEQDGQVLGRYKWIRPEFMQTLLGSGSHWRDRPMIANRLAPGVNLF
jgi:hypothetical protein